MAWRGSLTNLDSARTSSPSTVPSRAPALKAAFYGAAISDSHNQAPSLPTPGRENLCEPDLEVGRGFKLPSSSSTLGMEDIGATRLGA